MELHDVGTSNNPACAAWQALPPLCLGTHAASCLGERAHQCHLFLECRVPFCGLRPVGEVDTAARQGVVDMVTHMGCHGRHQPANGFEQRVQRMLAGRLVLRRRVGPEPPPGTPHIPVADIVDEELLQQTRRAVEAPLLEKRGVFLRNRGEPRERPAVERRQFGGLRRRIEIIERGVVGVKAIRIPERQEEAREGLAQSLWVEP